jgi:endoglucanase
LSRLRSGILALVVLAAVGTAAEWTRVRRAIKTALQRWPERERARAFPPESLFTHLAASQVGYTPLMVKRFSSPRRFHSFRVIREGSGTVAFEGGPPVQEIATTALGSAQTVWVGDFTTLVAPGRYRLEAVGLSSYPFTIDPGVFDAAVRAAQRAFYFQRSFTSIDATHAEGPWIHGDDRALAPPGVRGGWHDAGDFSLYSASLNTALFWMLEAYNDFRPTADDTNIPESGNGVPDLLDEVRWGLEWLLSVQDADGGFRNSTCLEQYGPYGTNFPEKAQPYRAGETGTLATARAVGSLAYGASVWRRFDPAFADRALQAASRGVKYLDLHPEHSDGPTCPAYRAEGDTHVGRQTRMFAAAGMLLATGAGRFRDDFEKNFEAPDWDPNYMRVGGFAAQLYRRAPAGDAGRKESLTRWLRERAERALTTGDQDPFGRSAPTYWGSIGAGFTRTGSSSARRCLEEGPLAQADCDQALANVHHALGRNPLGFSYFSGLPGVTHGRIHAFHHWFAALRATPFLPPGMVAGGPNANPESNDASRPLARPIPIWGYWGDPAFPRDSQTPYEARYTDNDSWCTNEVSLDWQASSLYGLYFAQWMGRIPLQRR